MAKDARLVALGQVSAEAEGERGHARRGDERNEAAATALDSIDTNDFAVAGNAADNSDVR